MDGFFDKANLPSAILHFIAGIISMISAFLLFFSDQVLQILYAASGLLLLISAVMIFFGEKNLKRVLIPLTYIAISAISFISMANDISKEYYGLGFTAELISGILFLVYAIISILKEFFNKNNLYMKIFEALFCFIQAACIFFMLFSYSSFGYEYSKSIEIFYVVLLYISFVVVAISNSIYQQVLEKK